MSNKILTSVCFSQYVILGIVLNMKPLTEKECMEALQTIRWKGEVRCINCNSNKVLKYGKDRKGFPRYMCKDCKKSFNDKSGTLFDGSQISIQEWFSIIGNFRKKSLRKISIDMGKPYNTIHACAKKLKEDCLAKSISEFLEDRKRSLRQAHCQDFVHYKQEHSESDARKGHEWTPPARMPRILMLGWEFYPKKVGGLGKVCYELSMALKSKGAGLIIILPVEVKHEGLDILSTNFETRSVKSILSPYLTQKSYNRLLMGSSEMELYGSDLFEEVDRYAEKCMEIAKTLDFDVIHAHDWMTYRAGILIKEKTGKPLVLHVHATEFDRGCGIGVNETVYGIEKNAFEKSDCVIAVSNFTKEKIERNYGIESGKIRVVHNAIDCRGYGRNGTRQKDSKVVLYFGRLTMQKGPDYFLKAAKRVIDSGKDVTFIMAGTGDMLTRMIEMACEMSISNRVLFTGYLTEEDAKRIYGMADIYVMPSVSEPFGVTALEAAASGVPVIVSKSSGVSEVVRNCMTVDFWDVEEMANKIISCISYDSLSSCMSENGLSEVSRMGWEAPAEKCIDIYSSLVR